MRRVSFVRVAQQVGLSLDEIRVALASLPANRTPNHKDWERLSTSWRPRLDAQIRMLERLRDRLDGCIGCGCLSLGFCKLANPDDQAASRGPGSPLHPGRGLSRVAGCHTGGSAGIRGSRESTVPNRSLAAVQSSYASEISDAGTGDEVPPHQQRLVERDPADQQPARRAR